MDQEPLEKMAERIGTIKKTAGELKTLSENFPAVDRNLVRLLASVKMLEINVSDLLG